MTDPDRPVTTTDIAPPAPAPVAEVRAELERLRALSEAITAAAAQIDAQRRTIERLLAIAAARETAAPAPAQRAVVPPRVAVPHTRPPAPIPQAEAQAPAPPPQVPAPSAAAPAPPASPSTQAHPGALRGPVRARRRAHPSHVVERFVPEATRSTADPTTQTVVARDSEAALATARLVALSMAASGSSRSEVARHLRSERGIQDTARVTDHVFGRPE